MTHKPLDGAPLDARPVPAFQSGRLVTARPPGEWRALLLWISGVVVVGTLMMIAIALLGGGL